MNYYMSLKDKLNLEPLCLGRTISINWCLLYDQLDVCVGVWFESLISMSNLPFNKQPRLKYASIVLFFRCILMFSTCNCSVCIFGQEQQTIQTCQSEVPESMGIVFLMCMCYPFTTFFLVKFLALTHLSHPRFFKIVSLSDHIGEKGIALELCPPFPILPTVLFGFPFFSSLGIFLSRFFLTSLKFQS